MIAASVTDYRALARRRLPPFLFEYIDGGSYDEITLARNVGDLQDVALRQRVLRDVSTLDTATELFGRKLSMPVALGPVGLAGMNARRGEVQAARAAETHGVPFCLSTVSVCPLTEVAAGVATPPWMQLYVTRDRGFVRDLIAKAREVRSGVLVLTVDLPVPGARYRDVRSGLSGATGPAASLRRLWQAATHPAWAWDVGLHGKPHHLGNVAPVLEGDTGLEDFITWMGDNFDASLTWKTIDFVRAEWPGPLVIKGILDAEDAREAVAFGADGIVVSNHGGRQLDGTPSTARALPAIADAVGDDLTILADGGVRSGLDVLRMMSLGAKGVLLGRAWAYALAGAGEAGVSHVLELIASELKVAMALTGVASTAEIDRTLLV